MPPPSIQVHLCPALLSSGDLPHTTAVVIDALRATTTITHALAAGCVAVLPCAEIDEARALATRTPGKVLLAGERDGVPIAGFDAGNSPSEYTPQRCQGATLVMTTTNGTRALLQAAAAEVVLLACFNNLSAVGELLAADDRPVHVLCAGDAGGVALEDTLVAGALAALLRGKGSPQIDDAGQLALAAFERHGRQGLEAVLASCAGGLRLRSLGYDDDIRTAARVDTIALVPRLESEPMRVTVAPSSGIDSTLTNGR